MDETRQKINSMIEANYSRFKRFALSQASYKLKRPDRLQWAEAIANEAILKTLRYLDNGGCEPDNFVGFVFRVIKNTSINAGMKKSERQFEEGSDDNIPAEGTTSYRKSGKTWLNSSDFGAEEKMAVENCLDGLDKTHREILLMNCSQGISTREIAEIIGKPQGSILRWLNQARIAFKACYEAS